MTKVFDARCNITWKNRAAAYGHFMRSKAHYYPREEIILTEVGRYKVYYAYRQAKPGSCKTKQQRIEFFYEYLVRIH